MRFEKSPLAATRIDLDCPDLGPILMVLGLFCEGETVIEHAGRLRIKESDRIASMQEELQKFGGKLACEGRDRDRAGRASGDAGAAVQPQRPPGGDGADHCRGGGGLPAELAGAQAVAKSWPEFLPFAAGRLADRGGTGMRRESRFVIVGLGLLGGAYARALRKAGYSRVAAIDLSQEALDFALREGYIAEGLTEGFGPLLEQADRLIFSLYPTATYTMGRNIWGASAPRLPVHRRVRRKGRPCAAGTAAAARGGWSSSPATPWRARELSGVQNAHLVDFAPANFLITPTERNTPEGLAFARQLAAVLGFAHVRC